MFNFATVIFNSNSDDDDDDDNNKVKLFNIFIILIKNKYNEFRTILKAIVQQRNLFV